jgi:transglutaminase-like putative cysteine protease/tetratricopeptide (TPR) repeat protein
MAEPSGGFVFLAIKWMRFLLRKLLLGTLLLIACTAVSATGNNPSNSEFQQLRSSWNSATKLQKLMLMERIYRLRDYVDDPQMVSQFFEEIETSTMEAQARGQQQTSAISAEADAYMSDISVLEGRASSTGKLHWYEDRDQRSGILAEAEKLAPTAENLELLARVEQLAGVPEAADHMYEAAQLGPTAARWANAAGLTNDPLKKFSALQSGLALDENNASLHLQLALYYIGRQQLEKSQSLLQSGLAAHPNDFVLGEHLAGLYLNLGLRSEALRQLRKIENGSSAIWLRARLALDYEQIGLLDQAARLAESVIRQKHTARAQLELLARIHERRHMIPELKADYSAWLRLMPGSVKFWQKLANLQVTDGELAQAEDSLLRVTALDPRNAEAHQQLAGIYAQLHLPEAAEKEKRAASELQQKQISSDDLDSGLLSSVKQLATDAFRHPPAEEDIALADTRVQEVFENGLSRVHIQQIFYVGSEAAAETHRVVGIRYSPGSEAVRLLHARVWKTNGTVIEAQEEGDIPAGEAAGSMYYDTRSRQVRFVGLEKGDVAELEYALSPTLVTSPYSGYFGELVTMAGRTPIRLKRYALVFPARQQIFYHADKLPPATSDEKNGRRTLLWEAHNIEPLPREPNSPGVTETSPYVHVSTMADWEKLGEWYAGLIRPQFTLDQSLKTELARIIQGKHSEEEKIRAIQEFVLRSTHYVALEFGIYSYKPYPVSQTYQRRFGDCKDKASLMIALLRAAGIEADIALVRTRSLGEVVPTPASMALFDHAIVYIPKYDLWLDGTAEYAGAELPHEDQGAMALTVSLTGAAQLRQVPVSSAAENYTRRTIHAELTREGVIRFNGSSLTRGEDAPRLRRDMAMREQRLDFLRQGLAQVFPSVEVDSVAVRGADDLRSDVSVDFEGALNSFRNSSVVTLRSSWMSRSYAALAPTSSRTQDLVLTSPQITEEEIHVALPGGAKVQQLPKDEEVRTGFGSVRLHYEKSSHEVVIQSRLEIGKSRISAQEYPAFRQFCSMLERSFRNEIVVGLAR